MTRPYAREYYVPTPSPATLFFRTFLPWQLMRFAWINLKMLRMISIGHHGRIPLRPIMMPDPVEPEPHAARPGGH